MQMMKIATTVTAVSIRIRLSADGRIIAVNGAPESGAVKTGAVRNVYCSQVIMFSVA